MYESTDPREPYIRTQQDDAEDWAEDHGYQHYRCPKHGAFWSDVGPYCEACGAEHQESDTDNVETED